jgi:hypothetical protein
MIKFAMNAFEMINGVMSAFETKIAGIRIEMTERETRLAMIEGARKIETILAPMTMMEEELNPFEIFILNYKLHLHEIREGNFRTISHKKAPARDYSRGVRTTFLY